MYEKLFRKCHFKAQNNVLCPKTRAKRKYLTIISKSLSVKIILSCSEPKHTQL